jgi:hypothetical protein
MTHHAAATETAVTAATTAAMAATRTGVCPLHFCHWEDVRDYAFATVFKNCTRL